MKEGAWTKADFDTLVRMHINGKTTTEIAEVLDRTVRAVAIKGSRIGAVRTDTR